MEDDWGLQAVVRGCATTNTTSFSTTNTTTGSVEYYSFSNFQPQQNDDFLCFPDLFEPRTERINEELHDLFKPFFPKPTPFSPQSIPISPLSVLGEIQQDLSQQPKRQKLQQQQQFLQQKQIEAKESVFGSRISANSAHCQSSRTKRRKNQLKRVCEVPAEGLSSDMWSWRKYGQKPIKGSPHPRGYYRCSTSKGCLARRQVERNRSDPAMFIVTYTGEHNHPMPTHRNSLAGSTRQKPVTSGETSKPSSSSPPVSPTSSLSPATENTESREERKETMEVEDEDDGLFGLSDMVVSDDFFVGLEELTSPSAGDLFSDKFPAGFECPWLANSAA